MAPSQEVIRQAQNIAANSGYVWSVQLEHLITFGLEAHEYLPKRRNMSTDLRDSAYLAGYVTAYYKDRDGIIVFKPSSTVPDPAVTEVLNAFVGQQAFPISPSHLEQAHRLSMTAENLVGKFLERYIASHLEQMGWIWCCGSTLRAVDFLKVSAGAYTLLQVKNRSNSENSSSSAIRAGTVIQKWHRIDARTGRTRWSELPDNVEDILTEDGFYQFIRSYVVSHA